MYIRRWKYKNCDLLRPTIHFGYHVTHAHTREISRRTRFYFLHNDVAVFIVIEPQPNTYARARKQTTNTFQSTNPTCKAQYHHVHTGVTHEIHVDFIDSSLVHNIVTHILGYPWNTHIHIQCTTSSRIYWVTHEIHIYFLDSSWVHNIITQILGNSRTQPAVHNTSHTYWVTHEKHTYFHRFIFSAQHHHTLPG